MAVAATFTVVQGPVAGIGWMFREQIYGPVRRVDPCVCLLIHAFCPRLVSKRLLHLPSPQHKNQFVYTACWQVQTAAWLNCACTWS